MGKILQAKPKTLTHVETPEPSPCTSQDPETYHPIEYISHYPTTTHFLPTPDVSPNEASHDTNYQDTYYSSRMVNSQASSNSAYVPHQYQSMDASSFTYMMYPNLQNFDYHRSDYKQY